MKDNLNKSDYCQCVLNLYGRLIDVINNGKVIFGHQNDTFYCVSQNNRSDVEAMVNDLPGLFGIDTLALGGFEMDYNSQNNSLRKSIEICKEAYRNGCLITLSMHAPNFATKNIIHDGSKMYFNHCTFEDCKLLIGGIGKEVLPKGKYNKELNAYLDLVCQFLLELQKEQIPVLFRPWHEHNGHWFWWGNPNISSDDYIELFRYTKRYLLSKEVKNVLYVYSPNGPFKDEEEYLERYPGDDVIDILALDYYDDYLYKQEYREDFFHLLNMSCEIVSSISKKKNKIPALSEVGVRVSKTKDNKDLNGLLKSKNPIKGKHWFKRVGEIVKNNNMPYYLVWGDFEINNTYLPYYFDDLSKHELVDEFIEFYEWECSIFASKK